jgi:shikimate kinase
VAASVTEGRHPHLVLVGLPGAGKSTVGPLVADRLGIAFVDLDLEVAERAGRPVPEIFALDGEATFRSLEREATRQLVGRRSCVVSPGGGWVTQPDVVALLRPPGRIIHLHVSPATAIARMGGDVAKRPLLSGGDPLAALQAIAGARESAYATADAVLDTETLSLQELVVQSAALASGWGVGVG